MNDLILFLSAIGGFITVITFLGKIFKSVSNIEKDILKNQNHIDALKEDCTEKFAKNEKDHSDIFNRLSNMEQKVAVANSHLHL